MKKMVLLFCLAITFHKNCDVLANEYDGIGKLIGLFSWNAAPQDDIFNFYVEKIPMGYKLNGYHIENNVHNPIYGTAVLDENSNKLRMHFSSMKYHDATTKKWIVEIDAETFNGIWKNVIIYDPNNDSGLGSTGNFVYLGQVQEE